MEDINYARGEAQQVKSLADLVFPTSFSVSTSLTTNAPSWSSNRSNDGETPRNVNDLDVFLEGCDFDLDYFGGFSSTPPEGDREQSASPASYSCEPLFVIDERNESAFPTECELLAEISAALKECCSNLAKNRDFRLARAEARLESGDVDTFETAHPRILKVISSAHYLHRSHRAGNHEDSIADSFIYLSGTDVATKLKLPRWAEPQACIIWSFIPIHLRGIRARHFNPAYVTHRCLRAINFIKNKNYSEVMSRLALMWDRRRGRFYFRRDPPENVPWAPTIAISRDYLSDNKIYEESAIGQTVLMQLMRKKVVIT